MKQIAVLMWVDFWLPSTEQETNVLQRTRSCRHLRKQFSTSSLRGNTISRSRLDNIRVNLEADIKLWDSIRTCANRNVCLDTFVSLTSNNNSIIYQNYWHPSDSYRCGGVLVCFTVFTTNGYVGTDFRLIRVQLFLTSRVYLCEFLMIYQTPLF
jgi:hypothetical protein